MQRREQIMAACHGAGQALADADRHRRRCRLAIRQHVEMGVEGRDLEDFDRREVQQLGQCDQVVGMQCAVAVLQRVEMLDQHVAPQGQVTERGDGCLPRRIRRTPATRAGSRTPCGPCRFGFRPCWCHLPGALRFLAWHYSANARGCHRAAPRRVLAPSAVLPDDRGRRRVSPRGVRTRRGQAPVRRRSAIARRMDVRCHRARVAGTRRPVARFRPAFVIE